MMRCSIVIFMYVSRPLIWTFFVIIITHYIFNTSPFYSVICPYVFMIYTSLFVIWIFTSFIFSSTSKKYKWICLILIVCWYICQFFKTIIIPSINYILVMFECKTGCTVSSWHWYSWWSIYRIPSSYEEWCVFKFCHCCKNFNWHSCTTYRCISR